MSAAFTPSQPVPGSRLALAAVFVATLLVRLLPASRGVAVDYDEGVYVTAAALLARGVLPYRDYVFLHPPGVVVLLLPFGAAGPLFALSAVRALVSVVGAFNATLMARLVGGRAALPAALFWVLWPELVWSERGVYLEPLMSCAGLSALVLVSLSPTSRRVLVAGVLCGVAVLIKSWGLVWCLAAFVLCPAVQRRRLVIAAVATFVLVLAPFLIAGGGEVFAQLVGAHLGRPPDGDLSRWVRLRELFVERNPWPAVLAVVLVPFLLLRGGAKRVAPLCALVLVAGFLAAPAYWNQYNAAVIPFEIWTLGVGLNAFLERAGSRWWVGVAVSCAAALGGLRFAIARPASDAPQRAVAARLRAVPQELCAFEVFELVLADRLPALTKPVLVDSYGQMLLDAQARGARFDDASAAFASEAAQRTVRDQLRQCAALRTGWRGDWQLNPASRSVVAQDFMRVDDGLYVRSGPAPKTSTPSQ